LFEEQVYGEAEKARMIELMEQLDLRKSDTGDFVILRRIRGQIVKRPRGDAPMEIVALGREDWVELRTEPVNEVAVLNTGRVIRDVDADVMAVIEAEDRVALKQFSEIVLIDVQGQPYEQIMVIDGNDTRGIARNMPSPRPQAH
jgi:hypothetical protein